MKAKLEMVAPAGEQETVFTGVEGGKKPLKIRLSRLLSHFKCE